MRDWAKENSMELNGKKFQLLQHGANEALKQPYDIGDGITIAGDHAVRDLGVWIDPGLTWKAHISESIRKAQTMAAWILRTFRTREKMERRRGEETEGMRENQEGLSNFNVGRAQFASQYKICFIMFSNRIFLVVVLH